MLSLTDLTTDELAQVSAAFNVLDHALDALARRGIFNEADGIDVAALYQAVNAEGRRRALEAAQLVCEQAVAAGHLEPVVRADGEVGYVLTEAGKAFAEGA